MSWLKTLDAVEALPADIIVPGHGPIPEDSRETRQGLHHFRRMLVDLRDAAIKLPQYEQMQRYKSRREVAARRTYREMMGMPK